MGSGGHGPPVLRSPTEADGERAIASAASPSPGGSTRPPARRADGRPDTRRREPLFDDAFLRRLDGLRLRARRLSGAPVGARPGRQRTPAADFIDHRPYSPGDDLRYVNWPALARHDTVHVKVGQVRQATRVDLLLDLSRSMAQPLEKGRFALRLAGALGWLSLVAGDRVTLHGFPAAEGSTWGPGTGPGAGIDLLRSVAECSFDATESGLEPAARRVSRNSMAGGLAVVISDLWLADDLERALGHLPPPRWDLLLLHVLGREELDPGFRGPVQVEDAETGELVTLVADDDLVRAYRREVRAWAERLRSVAARRGATYALLPADWPIDRAVLPYLQRRAILGG